MKNELMKYISVDGNDYNIPIIFNEKTMFFNVTEITKQFNKEITGFLRDKNRSEIVIKLCIRNSSNTLIINDRKIYGSLNFSELAKMYPESIIINKGANNIQGTYVHEDIFLEYARWISPDFAIWSNDIVKEHIFKRMSYRITAEKMTPIQHLDVNNQKYNSKAIAMKNYGITQDRNKIIKHFAEICKLLTDKYPREIKKWAKDVGIPQSIINKGAREILRYVQPVIPIMFSMIENILSSTDLDIDKDVIRVAEFVKTYKQFFIDLKEFGNFSIEPIYDDIKILNK